MITLKSWELSAEYVDQMLEAEIERRKEWIQEWFGHRCDVFDRYCMICRMWKRHDEFVKLIRGRR